MAAGRHGGYRDNEFRGREAEFEVSRRELGYSKGDYERIRSEDRDFDRDRVHDRSGRDRGRLRQKDVKERDLTNGSFRSMSSRSDSGSSDGDGGGERRSGGLGVRAVDREPIKERDMINGSYRSGSSRSDSGSSDGDGDGGGMRRSGLSVRAVDREPGELSSESGSDGAIESDQRTKNAANGNQSSVQSKKRKFSPIIWDREDKEVNRMSKSRNSPAAAKLPPPPPLPKSSGHLANFPPERVEQVSLLNTNNVHSMEPSPSNINTALGLLMDASHESPVDICSPPVDEEQLPSQETRKVEDEEYVPVPTIRSSRWATDADSPADEGEISGDDTPLLKKRRAVSQSAEMGGRRKSLTPEYEELKREGSGGNRTRSSDSDEHIRSCSRESYQGNELDKNDSMDVDKDRNYDGTSVSSDTESEDEHDSRGTPEAVLPPQRSVNMLQGCRSVDEFERLNRIDEGTYGVVYRAKDKKTGEIVALKKVKMEKEREGFPLTSLREINILLSLHHPSIVDVKEVVVGSSLDSIFMVMEYMEHDLKALMETMKKPFTQSEVKCLMLQLLHGVKYLHDNWVLHRDLKTSNLLLNNQGELKICDFGLARQYGSPLKPYTHLVVTLWYRAPELLLGAKQYSTAIDMWSLGCIMAEMLCKEPLFNGKSEVDQIDKIFRILGTPNETIWPGFSKLPGVKVNFVKHQFNNLRNKFQSPTTSFMGKPDLSESGLDLLNKLLTYDPAKRLSADAALNHEWFREVPLPKSKEFMPTFPAQHAQDRRVRRVMKSPDPLEEQRRKELKQGVLGTGGLFG